MAADPPGKPGIRSISLGGVTLWKRGEELSPEERKRRLSEALESLHREQGATRPGSDQSPAPADQAPAPAPELPRAAAPTTRAAAGRTYSEHLDYLAGELPGWANAAIPVTGLVSVAAGAAAVVAALAAVGVPQFIAGGAGCITLIGGVAFCIKRVDPYLNRLQDRRSRRRRLAMGLLPTPDCPDRCDCPEHLVARVQAAEDRARRAEEELARLRR